MILAALAATAMVGRWEVSDQHYPEGSVGALASAGAPGRQVLYYCQTSIPPQVSFQVEPNRFLDPGWYGGASYIDDATVAVDGGWFYQPGTLTPAEPEDLIPRLRNAAHRVQIMVGGAVHGDFDMTGAREAFAEADRRCATGIVRPAPLRRRRNTRHPLR